MASDIKWDIKEDDVQWTMTWGKQSPDKPPTEEIFENEFALAHLLMNEVIFINNHWWEKEWPENARKTTSLNVNCNDVFAWGCADAEELLYSEIETLYRMWRKDPVWGSAVWCMVKRNQMPQKPVEDRIRAAGIWDFDQLKLGENTQAAEVEQLFAQLRSCGKREDSVS